MKKIILPLLIITSFATLAQTEKDVIKQLEAINNLKQVDQCERCEDEEQNIYTPQKALQDINAGKLTFMGRAKFPGSASNLTCVYKSDRAYVLYNNCMANRKEAPATDIEVISFEGGLVSFYIENSESPAPISTLTRADYSMSWKLSYVPLPKPGKLDIEGLKKYMDYDFSKYGACFIGKTFEARNKESKSSCSGKMSHAKELWAPDADKFWLEPGQEWHETKQKLWKTVSATKF